MLVSSYRRGRWNSRSRTVATPSLRSRSTATGPIPWRRVIGQSGVIPPSAGRVSTATGSMMRRPRSVGAEAGHSDPAGPRVRADHRTDTTAHDVDVADLRTDAIAEHADQLGHS